MRNGQLGRTLPLRTGRFFRRRSGIPEAKEMLEEMGYDEEDVQDTAVGYESLIVEHVENSS